MALAFASSPAIHGSLSSSSHEQTKGIFGVFVFLSDSAIFIRFIGPFFIVKKFVFFAAVASKFGSFQQLDRLHVLSASVNNVSSRHSAVRPLNAKAKRNNSIVPSAATLVAPGNSIKIFEQGFLFFPPFFLCFFVSKLYLLWCLKCYGEFVCRCWRESGGRGL